MASENAGHCEERSDEAIPRGAAIPAIIVHSLAHAVAALSAAGDTRRPVTLLSAPCAGIYGGASWFRELVAAAHRAAPTAECAALLDCGADAGAAQAAIRARVAGIVFTGRSELAARLADVAGQRGVRLLTERPAAALDFAQVFFADPETLRHRCADILASHSGFC